MREEVANSQIMIVAYGRMSVDFNFIVSAVVNH